MNLIKFIFSKEFYKQYSLLCYSKNYGSIYTSIYFKLYTAKPHIKCDIDICVYFFYKLYFIITIPLIAYIVFLRKLINVVSKLKHISLLFIAYSFIKL